MIHKKLDTRIHTIISNGGVYVFTQGEYDQLNWWKMFKIRNFKYNGTI